MNNFLQDDLNVICTSEVDGGVIRMLMQGGGCGSIWQNDGRDATLSLQFPAHGRQWLGSDDIQHRG
jgi:hypothetical protein